MSHVPAFLSAFFRQILKPVTGFAPGFACIMLLVSMLSTLPASAAESPRGPDVVIIKGKDRVVYEFRQNGELRMVRVVPKWGKPYYLVPRDETRGFGDLQRADMLLPKWIIAEF